MTGDLIIGGALTLGVSALGWLVIATAPTADAADASIREFGTLLTVQFGIVAALWWNQSAKLSDKVVDQDAPTRQSQKDVNVMNGAAATFTALSVISSVFASSPWRSTGSWVSGIGVLLLLTMAGSDVRQAVPISLKQRLQLREIIGLLSLAIVITAFVWHLIK